VSIQVPTLGIVSGRGIAKDLDLSVTKAAAECLERTFFLAAEQNVRTTNGLAVHTSLITAASSAMLELIERDLFLCHYLSKTPFGACEPDSFSAIVDFDVPSLRHRLKKQGIDLEIGLMNAPRGFSAHIVCAIGSKFKAPFGAIVGLGCSTEGGSSLESALMESMRDVVAEIEGNPARTISKSEFLSKKRHTVDDHLHFSRSAEAAKVTQLLFKPKAIVDRWDGTGFINSITAETVYPPGALTEVPLHCVRAKSDMLQNLFFGPTNPAVVNLSRISNFCKRDLNFEDLEQTPHTLA
jgi:hypothetical protein